ncbi:MAG: hypothetical protein FJX29_09810 [Alphaproteobacteria bacterium]|nr:hypothetical protein [Alphaproteobacteria bacterium]
MISALVSKRLLILSAFALALAAGALLAATSIQSGGVQAGQDSANCQIIEVPADAGYGVSEVTRQRVCR